MDLLARAPSLWAHVKIYADGGENGLHAHPAEDHLFLVLDGEATFYDDAGTETVVTRYEGMIVPRGAFYRFRSTGPGNLVMVRVGAPADGSNPDWLVYEPTGVDVPRVMLDRVAPSGAAAPGDDAANGTGAVRGVPAPGRYFSVDRSDTHA